IDNLFEDFDSTPVGSTSNATIPECWSYIDDVTSTGYGYTIASDPLSGANSFRLHRTNSSGNSSQELVLISPETDNLGNGTKQLRFYARSYLTTTYVNKLEILSMPSDTTTVGATVLATFYPDQKFYEEYVVPLPATTDDFFGFRLAYNGVTPASNVILDDVYLEDLETCFPPKDVAVSNITQTTAVISWSAAPSSGASQYDSALRCAGVPGSGSPDASGTVSGTTATATGLSPSVMYYVYVRSICGTETSRWTQIPGDFYTLCGVI